MYGATSVLATASPSFLLSSSAHCWMALSIWRMLVTQAFDCEVLRALTKLGIAIAARRPMMATTIMISTRVKPSLREVLIFICFNFCVSVGGVNTATGGLFYQYGWCSLIACCNRTSRVSNRDANGLGFCIPESGGAATPASLLTRRGYKKEARSVAPGIRDGANYFLLQHVRRIAACVRTLDARAGIHIGANRIYCAAGRASRHHVAFDVLRNFSLDNRVRVLLALLECPLLDRTVYLSQDR